MLYQEGMIVFLVCCIIIVLLLFTGIIETFVAFNADNVPDKRIVTLYETNTMEINNIIKRFQTLPLPDFRTVFFRSPYYENFPLSQEFKDKLMHVLRPLFNELYKDTKTEIVRDLYDIYWADSADGTRHFVFALDIHNPVKAFTRRFRVYMTLPYYKNLQGKIQDENIVINHIAIENDIDHVSFQSSEHPIGQGDYTKYYKIKNTLYLMDPFITSGKDMMITEEMRMTYDLVK